jgi:hypothetical protein
MTGLRQFSGVHSEIPVTRFRWEIPVTDPGDASAVMNARFLRAL